MALLDKGVTCPFKLDKRGLLVRTSPVDKSEQIVVPEDLRSRVLFLAHFPRMSGHPGGTRMFSTLRRQYYWPSMAMDVHATVRGCPECAKERINLRKHASFLKLFPAAAPLEFVAIDILGPLRPTPAGNKYLLVITDRFSKLTKTVPLKTVTSFNVATAFCRNWVFVYGPPVYLLSDNGGQFTSKYFSTICNILGVRNLYTSAYHPETNGQAERFNPTILSALRRYICEDATDWDQFSDAVTYGYNCQVHRITGVAPFELVLSRPPGHLSLENTPSLSENLGTKQYRHRFQTRLRNLIEKSSKKIQKAQSRYKADFDRRIRPPTEDIESGHYVYLGRETAGDGVKQMLTSPVSGPFKVLKSNSNTIVILTD